MHKLFYFPCIKATLTHFKQLVILIVGTQPKSRLVPKLFAIVLNLQPDQNDVR